MTQTVLEIIETVDEDKRMTHVCCDKDENFALCGHVFDIDRPPFEIGKDSDCIMCEDMYENDSDCVHCHMPCYVII